MDDYATGGLLNGSPITLDVTLIHNNNPERVEPMRLVLETLKNLAPQNVRVSLTDEVSWQPETLTTLFRDRLQWAFANAAAQYLFFRAKSGFTAFSFLQSSISATSSLIIYLMQEIRDALTKRQFSARHRQVSRKHSVAWSQFCSSSSSEWLLVLEDDALLTDAGAESLWGILQEAQNVPANVPSFLLVSEGLNLDLLKLNVEDFRQVSSRLSAPRFPFTNTAAAYLVNRSLATHFVETLRKKPGLTYNTIDFLINNMMLGISLDAKSSKIFCHHATTPPFQNGSINGVYSSLISS